MELTNATNLISTIASNKQQEVDALNLAVKMLSGTFQPELTRIQTAEAQVQSMNETNIALTTEKAQLQNEKETEKSRADTAEATIVEKENEIARLKEQMAPAEPIAEVK